MRGEQRRYRASGMGDPRYVNRHDAKIIERGYARCLRVEAARRASVTRLRVGDVYSIEGGRTIIPPNRAINAASCRQLCRHVDATPRVYACAIVKSQ